MWITFLLLLVHPLQKGTRGKVQQLSGRSKGKPDISRPTVDRPLGEGWHIVVVGLRAPEEHTLLIW